jgi:hypothetical protein
MVIPLTPRTPQYRVPSIAAGMGEKPKPEAPPQSLVVQRTKPSRGPAATASARPKTQVASACAPDEQRLTNYAGRMVAGLGLGPKDDLKLFASDGKPLPNLAPVMLAMSAVELGALKASPDLVEAAVQRLSERTILVKRAEP